MRARVISPTLLWNRVKEAQLDDGTFSNSLVKMFLQKIADEYVQDGRVPYTRHAGLISAWAHLGSAVAIL